MTVGELVDLFPLEQKVRIDEWEGKAIDHACNERAERVVDSCRISADGILVIHTETGMPER